MLRLFARGAVRTTGAGACRLQGFGAWNGNPGLHLFKCGPGLFTFSIYRLIP